MDPTTRIALYARVSSQRQADDATIQSQVAALEHRIAADGFRLEDELRFLDDGSSGSTLLRPALERLRDAIHVGGVERLYVHSPDRLARKFVHQAVLLDEFAKRHVDVVFLNQPLGQASPEGNLLVQMQGMIAEYEREKILERTRRGRRFSARQGRVSVLGHAPFGYRYVTKHAGDGAARYDIVPEEARIVRDLFRWVALEGLSLKGVTRRLAEHGVPTRTGRPRWDVATVRGILLNPAYYGEAHWGKTRMEERPSTHRPRRGRPEVPRQEKVARPTPPEIHEIIPVPAVIDRDLFAAVGERLQENRLRQRTHERGASYLLGGLLVCGRCGSAYCGRKHRQGHKLYLYYRCIGTDKYRHGGEPLCDNAAVGGDLEDRVWADVCDLLENPERLRAELQRRQDPSPAESAEPTSRRASIARLKRQLARLLDMYETGFLEKAEFAARARRVKDRLAREEGTDAEQSRAEQSTRDQDAILADFQQFADGVRTGLNQMDFATKRQILSLLIKRIEVGDDQIQIVYKVQHSPFASSPSKGSLQHRLCCQRPLQGRPQGIRFPFGLTRRMIQAC